MIMKELLSPLNLIRAQNIHIHKLVETIIVYKDKDLIFIAI